MKQLEKNIGYHFRDKNLLKTAVTHSSYANENRGGLAYNERLEFLGDAVLQLITSEKLFTENPDMPEGRMSKQRAALVCEDALAGYSNQLHIGDFMLLGKGEETTGGRHRPSILADAFEAILAAIYLDGGMEPAKKHILRFIKKELSLSERYEITLVLAIGKHNEEPMICEAKDSIKYLRKEGQHYVPKRKTEEIIIK